MVIADEALLLGSCTEVAVTAKEPVLVPAVKSPVEETVPPVADHVTAVFAALMTVAANCCVALVNTVALAGEIETATACGAGIVIAAVALLLASWTLVAVT